MSEPPAEDPLLVRPSEICLAFPEAIRDYEGQHAAFRVPKRTFAYYLDDHHGDGMVALNCKVASGENEALAESDPQRFHLPAYLGPRGWIGMRLDTPTVDWAEVAELVTDSYLLIAPRPSPAR